MIADVIERHINVLFIVFFILGWSVLGALNVLHVYCNVQIKTRQQFTTYPYPCFHPHFLCHSHLIHKNKKIS